MDQHLLVNLIIFLGFFLALIAVLQNFCSKYSLPYTVIILVSGFISQFTFKLLNIDFHFSLDPLITFYILLPLLLFESSFHINLHQFKMQFKTISFLATFGLLVSILTVGLGLSYLAGIPLGVALLFGALISATDPIAVITLFKTLGAPKRLSLVADGESMFNDATAVIAFRLISVFVLTGAAFAPIKLFGGLGSFVYIFFGSIIFGSLIGYICAKALGYLKSDRLVENSLTFGLALFSFVGAEHFFHLSGVISTVMAGVVLGNLAKLKIERENVHFIHEWWEYIAFLSVSLVFFFAAFNLNLGIFSENPLSLLIAVFLVLVARAVSVYLSVFISNRIFLFKDEPNLPMSWQHILNWGGLRGVIPLVLVYSLPNDFAYKSEILAFTLFTLVFTLLINGLTIKPLLLKLGLHLPRREEQIMQNEKMLFEVEKNKKKLSAVRQFFSPKVIREVSSRLSEKERSLKMELDQITNPKVFEKSLKTQILVMEKELAEDLYREGKISDNAYFEFDSELDLQQDALEYQQVKRGRGIRPGGFVDSSKSYRVRILKLRRLASTFSVIRKFFKYEEKSIILDRYDLLVARIATSKDVISFLKKEAYLFRKNFQKTLIKQAIKTQEALIEKNGQDLEDIHRNNPEVVDVYQRRVLRTMINI